MKKLPLILSLLSLNLVLFGTVSCGDILPDEDEKPIVNKPTLKVEETLHGSISLSVENNYCDIDNLEIGVTILVGVTPETGYVLDTLTVNNEDIKDSRKFVISEKIEYDVVATFKTSETTNEFASLEIKTPQNGTISLKNENIDLNKITLGTEIEFNVSPSVNYELNQLLIDNVDITNSLKCTLNEAKKYVVTATFNLINNEEEYASLIINSSINGTVKVTDTSLNLNKIPLDTIVEFEVTPDKDYQLSSLTINGVDITQTLKYQVSEAKKYVVDATFKKINTETIIANIDFTNVTGNEGTPYNPSADSIKTTNIKIKDVSSQTLFTNPSGGVRFSSSGNASYLELTFDNYYEFSTIELNGLKYNNDTSTVKVELGTFENSFTFNTNNVINLNGKVESNTLRISSGSKNRFILQEINLYIGEGSIVTPDPGSAYVTVNSYGYGDVVLDKKEGKVGDTIHASITPRENYYTSSVTFNDQNITDTTTTDYYLTLKAGENKLNVYFKSLNGSTSDYSYLYANDIIKPSRGNGTDIDSYYESVRGLKGPELKEGLNKIIKGHTTYSYNSLNETMKVTDIDPFNSSNIILTYEGSKPKNTSFNKEHTRAKSIGSFGTSRGPGSDMHHLRPSNSNLNSTRSNFDFAENSSGKDVADSYSWGTESMRGNKVGNNLFEPKDEFKGDVARMIFYMATRYEGNDGYCDLEVGVNRSYSGIDSSKYYVFTGAAGYHGNFNDLYKWATTDIDPVSDFEVNRNNLIDQKYQHNRNPFIDHPEFIIMIYDKTYDGPGALEE